MTRDLTRNDTKAYWDQRAVGFNAARAALSRVKASPTMLRLLEPILSLRVATECFLERTLRKFQAQSVLDVACGEGQSVLGRLQTVAGVDILGYPQEIARRKGYNSLMTYTAPEYRIETDSIFDAVTIINLNAHLPLNNFMAILQQALLKLKQDGLVIMVCEYDNAGLSYRWFGRNRDKKEKFVRGMEHYFLSTESEFMSEVLTQHPGLRVIQRVPLIGSVLPGLHYFAFLMERNPSRWPGLGVLAADIPLSMLNFLQTRSSRCENKAFQVGYVIRNANHGQPAKAAAPSAPGI